MAKKPVLLCIMDGFGWVPEQTFGNAIAAAKRPNLDRLFETYPYTTIQASGMAVGLPEGQMGNSEVGHTNMGAGRIVYQQLTLITKSIMDGTMKENDVLVRNMRAAIDAGKAVHLMGLLGTGVGRLGGNEKNVARTAYDYDYGASDTYEAYPQEDAVALYENSAPALGARSAAEKGAANDSTAEDEKKIVRNAWLTLKTERFDEAVSALCGQIEQAGGVVESRDISGAKNASRSASLTLRVPSDMLDGVLSGASEWGEVTREQTSAVDMTSTYTDNASRLESARAKKRQLDALYEKAETMEDIITLTDAIFDVQEEIEWLEGQNRRIDNQASMATLYVTINEKSSAVAAKQPLLTRMGEEFIEGMENFGEFVFGAVLGLIYALPWAVVAAVVIALARRWVRKKKKQ